jgi:poly-gamma-glutamate synthesis protein (capsule biosynthesis protein)
LKKQIILCLCVFCILVSFSGCDNQIHQNEATQPIQPIEPSTTQPITEFTEPETTTPPETEPIVTDPPTTEPTATEPAPTEPLDFNIVLSFVGDCMLASNHDKTTSGSFNEYVNQNSPEYFLEKVRSIFEADDFTIVNLENVFTDEDLNETAKNHDPAYWYKSKTSNVNILTCSSVEGVSLANNHTYDYGTKGQNDTIQTVTDSGLQYGLNSQIMYFEKEGFTVAVICSGLWGEWQANDIVKLIKTAEEKSDYQIVFYHGGKEKVHEPDEWKVRASHKLVDNGADLVIGNHPHVLQPREVYDGVEIIYSLGNFCYGGSRRPENRTMVYQMKLTIDKETLDLCVCESTMIPCYVYTNTYNNYQPAPIEDEEEIQKVLDYMNGLADSPL